MIYTRINKSTGDIDKVVILCKEGSSVRLYKGQNPNIENLKRRSRSNPEIEYYTFKINSNENVGSVIKVLNENLYLLKNSQLVEKI